MIVTVGTETFGADNVVRISSTGGGASSIVTLTNGQSRQLTGVTPAQAIGIVHSNLGPRGPHAPLPPP